MRGRVHAAGLPAIALATAGWLVLRSEAPLRRVASAVMLAAALWGCSGTPIVYPEGPKIEHLLEFVARTKDATFLIDGQNRDASFAADYLRRGLEEKRADVRTAKDFIEKAGSFSSKSGGRFLVQFADGNQTFLGDWLLAELERHEIELRRSR